MDITYFGHSSFRLKGKDASLVTDPFDPKMVGLKYSGVEGDIVTVSHAHDDHNKTELVKGAQRIIDGPGEYEVKGISIIGLPSFHDKVKGEERGKNIIFVYEIDGLRLCHLGDLGHKLSDELLEEIGDIDILMIPVGGPKSITVSEATEIVRDIEPSIVLPMHYNMGNSMIPGLAGIEPFLKEVGLTVEKLPKLSVKKEDFVEESQKVVELEKK